MGDDLSMELMRLYRTLREHFGHQHWWPGDTPLEILVGAILTQQTTWRNVEKAIQNMKIKGLLDLGKIAEGGEGLEQAIRPSGYYRQKTKRLALTATSILEHYDNLGDLLRLEKECLRKELLSINGIGPETADSIILYAAERPIFVVDAYTFRIMRRVGFYHGKKDYHILQEIFHTHLPMDLDLFKDFHAQFVMLGKTYCKPKPQCTNCPLREKCSHAKSSEA